MPMIDPTTRSPLAQPYTPCFIHVVYQWRGPIPFTLPWRGVVCQLPSSANDARTKCLHITNVTCIIEIMRSRQRELPHDV
eukprot:6124093-Pleurochrysis_carterae.AAC.4